MGALGYMGEAWDPPRVFEDQNSPGKVGVGSRCQSLGNWSNGHTPRNQKPPPGRRAVTAQEECELGGKRPGPLTSGRVCDFGQVTVFPADSTISKGACSSKLMWNPAFLGSLLCLVEAGSPNSARSGCVCVCGGLLKKKKRLGSKGEAEGGSREGRVHHWLGNTAWGSGGAVLSQRKKQDVTTNLPEGSQEP